MAYGVDPRAAHERAELEEQARRQITASARWREFADLPEAEGKTRAAINLANNTTCTIEEARRVLRSAPPDEQHMARLPNANVGPDQATEEESQEAYMAGLVLRARQREGRA